MTKEEAIKILQDVQNPRIREAICTLHPELRESEDEKIRKFLIKLVNDGFTHFPDSLTRNGVLTYLEKQKESTWTEEDESFRKHILPRILDPKGWTMEQIDADKKRLEEFVERQKNKWIEKQKEQEHICDSAKFEEGFKTGLEIGLRKQKEQKPEERFKEAREKYQVEWSEEDREIIDNAIKQLYRYADSYHNGGNYTREKEVRKVAYELKSLSPSWKPSELEKGALRTAIHILTDERSFPKAAAQLQNILDAFE